MSSSLVREVHPSGEHTHTIIMLHGRDSNASEFSEEFLESQASDKQFLTEIFPTLKWVFPAANKIRSTRFDQDMSQWFDMWETENPYSREHEQLADLTASISMVAAVIEQESTAVGAQNVILGGISQGCATAIHALLQGQRRLGGFVGLSSWMPLRNEHDHSLESTGALQTPVFLAHCQDDDVIAIEYGRELRDSLQLRGMSVEWNDYEEGGHWMNEPQGVDELTVFLRRVLVR